MSKTQEGVEAGVPLPSLSGSGLSHSPFPPTPTCLLAWWPPAEAELPLWGHKAWVKHAASLWA